MDRELLETYGEGIIATTGCPSGEVQRLLQQDRFDDACQAASDYRDIFGKENFFCELMDHGIAIERQVQDDLLELKKRSTCPAWPPTTCTTPTPRTPSRTRCCCACRPARPSPTRNRFKFDAQDFYLKSPAEMRAQWDGEFPEACDNTLLDRRAGARRVHRGPGPHAPRARSPRARASRAGWSRRSSAGLQRRFPRRGRRSATGSRPSTRSASSARWAIPGYFLVTADLISYAKSVGIRVGPGRGSAAGSLVGVRAGHHRPRPDPSTS